MSKVESKTPRSEISKSKRASFRARILEDFLLIWLHPDNNELTKTSLNQLRKILHSILIFSDLEQCLEYLSQIEHEQIFLIISHPIDSQLLSRFESISPINTIYLFTDQTFPFQSYPKVKGFYKKFDLICQELQHDIKQYQHDLTPMSILKATSITNFNELDQTFIYSQLIKEILLDKDSNDQAKIDLFDFCRIQYGDNRYALQMINEFKRDYPQPSAIWWYRRDSFLSSMLNKALRIQDTEIIDQMGFFIRDLHEQIEEVYSQMNSTTSLTVYHAQRISNIQFEQFVQNQGELLSFRHFFLTTTNRHIALNYLKQSSTRPNLISVLFQIEINPSVVSSPFASVDQLSCLSDRKNEILFSLHTIFRIGQIKQLENQFWQIDLTLTNGNDEQLTGLMEAIGKHARGETGLHRLAKFMLIMGQIDKAKEIYTALLANTSENDPKELAYLYHQLALIADEKDDLNKALSHYHQSLNIYLKYLPLNDPQLCPTYSKIGLILKKQRNYDGALEYLHHALDIGLIAPNSDQYEIAIRYNNIASVFDAQGKWSEALEYYQHALDIEQKCLPNCHPLIEATHNNIGLVYQSLKNYPLALIHFSKTLEIEEKILPSDHPSLILTHANLAGILENLQQYQEAIDHAEKAVQIVQNVLGIDHPHSRMLNDYLKQLREKIQ